jgi:low affinity Fe/Cu permease
MSLGIFSFDLAALINSLSNFIDISQPETIPADLETTLDKTEDVLQNSTATAAHSKIDDILMAAALESTITSVISTESTKNPAPLSSTSKPLVPTVTLDEETKKEIERLIKSLQTSVVHNYQSTDIIDETISLNNARNFPRRNFREDSESKKEGVRQERKSEEHKLEMLREELKKSILKNNSDV